MSPEIVPLFAVSVGVVGVLLPLALRQGEAFDAERREEAGETQEIEEYAERQADLLGLRPQIERR